MGSDRDPAAYTLCSSRRGSTVYPVDMKIVLASAAASLLVLTACEGGGNVHEDVARCIARRVQTQSTPGVPVEEWPRYVEQVGVDDCAGDRYGPTVGLQLEEDPSLDAERLVAQRIRDVLLAAPAPSACEALLACPSDPLPYVEFGDCLLGTETSEVQSAGENLLGCEGSLDDNRTVLGCATFVLSALAAACELCYR
jgi:hypothetical protein